MSKIEDLIKQYCPNGCEWKSFYDVATYIRGVSYPKSKDLGISGNGHKLLRANNIDLKSNLLNLTSVKIVDYSVKVKKSQMLMADDILICAGSGSKEHIGKVSYIDEDMDYTFGGFMGVIRSNKNEIHPRYMFHILMSPLFRNYIKSSDSSTINNINNETWKNFQIPIPPLPVQEEIVRILDEFKELEMRKKQYEWYRDELLTFGDDVERKRLGDKSLFNFRYGTGNNIPADTGGKYDVYGSNGIVSHINDYNCEDVSIIGHIGAYAGIVNRCRGKCFVTYNGTIASVVDTTRVDSQYFHHVLNELNLQSMKKGSQPFLSVSDFSHLQVPIPSLQEQQRIVEILDTFDTLTTDLTKGLPAEIKMRRMQYEYYRDYLFGLLK
ncbi:Type I restriction enzyme specificity protein MPN_089 [Anaerostipes hadrus]|uniref:Type I restriction enzyme specificity protein MPN_089 n=1 Tax=Anaerostipes hadrus TaxID=649756 RepID=A0A174JF69_ANAHA|nr:restriction endonuclease subunit S [Anaerostipes hadrus]CUO96856.1 Type I restriction enzyme specificity protein MPN_089 [Anaerostipes hadrus]